MKEYKSIYYTYTKKLIEFIDLKKTIPLQKRNMIRFKESVLKNIPEQVKKHLETRRRLNIILSKKNIITYIENIVST